MTVLGLHVYQHCSNASKLRMHVYRHCSNASKLRILGLLIEMHLILNYENQCAYQVIALNNIQGIGAEEIAVPVVYGIP